LIPGARSETYRNPAISADSAALTAGMEARAIS
jgi:hypothetical protein